MKSKVITVEEFEKVISNNISSKLKGLLKSPHRYIIRFTLLGEDKYKLEIIRYKKLNISTTQKLSSLQILHHINKEESTEDIRMKNLSITMGEDVKKYKATMIKSISDGCYYFKATALACTFYFKSDELTVDNAKKIAKSIFIEK